MKLTRSVLIFGLVYFANGIDLRFLALKNCTANKEALKLELCQVTEQGVFVKVEILKPLKNFFVKYHLYKIEDQSLKKVFEPKEINWCNFMNDKKNTNPMAKAFVETFKKSIPQAFKPCPYTGRMDFNFTYDKKRNLIFMLPTGKFLTGEKMFNDEFGDFFTISFIIELY